MKSKVAVLIEIIDSRIQSSTTKWIHVHTRALEWHPTLWTDLKLRSYANGENLVKECVPYQ